MLAEANLIVISLSENALNATLSICVAFLGVSLSLLTLSVAFVISGKATRSDLIDSISKEGISITKRSQFLNNKSATSFMSIIAKWSLVWLICNFFFTFVFGLYILSDTQILRVVISYIAILYYISSIFFTLRIFIIILKWYKKHIK